MSCFKSLLVKLFCLVSTAMLSQDYSSLWEGHFSYLDIKDIAQSSTKVYAATDNAIFVYDTNTNQIEKITTIEGLSGQTISNIYFSETYGRLLIGYVNGLIEIVSDGNEILTVVDILDKQTIPPNLKRINHFYEDAGVVYISTNYGISVYDLERLEFGDTYYIGPGGTHIAVNQTTVIDDYIYAACGNNSAIKKALKTNPNLIHFNQWQTIDSGNFLGIVNVNDILYAIKSNNVIYRITNDVLNSLFTYPAVPVDMRSENNYLIVTILNRVYIYDSNFNLIVSPTTTPEFNTQFSSAIVNSQDEILIGTTNIINLGRPGRGILKTNVNDVSIFQEIHPDGPLLNNVFSIQTPPNEIWAVFGGYSVTFNFNGGIQRTGISHYKNDQWINKPYDSIASVITNPYYLSHLAVNPFNTNQVYISSYYSGVIEINNDEVIQIYNQSNSSIMPFSGALHLATASFFDRRGVYWMTNSRAAKALNKLENSTWTSYDFLPIIDPPTSNLGYSAITSDASGNIFIGSYAKGLIGQNQSNQQLKFIDDESNNMPSPYVKALAFDNNNQLWIGTTRGIRILYNSANFFTETTPRVNEIVILEDGIPQELLANQVIMDIEVDGSNNKWVATGTSGVFYFSPDGQNTIYHFTTDNSPLPSNTINDISIDPQTGKVYFATIRGLVSFNSGGSKTEDVLDNAFVYPNPVRPEYNILGASDLNDITKGVKIKGLTERVNVKITDIEGNLVAEAQSGVNLRASTSRYNFAIDGGTAIWNGKNLRGNVVASGVYLIMISDLDTFETKVLKLLIIR